MEDIFQKGQNITIKVVLVVIAFSIAKAVAGALSGSVVLLADAVHSAADSFSMFLVWVGLKIARKKPTEKFQYGYYKAENLSALLVSGLILYAGFEIIRESVSKILISYQLHIPLIAISVALLDAIVMFLLGTYEVKIGRKINAQSLVADGSESRMHLLSSSVVLIGLFSAYFQIPYVEGIAGILISFFILAVGIKSGRDSVLALMDVSPSPEIEREIKKILQSFSDLRDFGKLKLRKSGPFIFGEAKVRMKKFVNIERAHEITKKIEQEIKDKIPQIDSFLIYIEPFRETEQKIIIPIKEEKGIDSQISPLFSRAKFFIVLKTKEGRLESWEFRKNPFFKKEIRAGLAVAKYVLREKPDVFITKEMGPIAFHTLRDNLIEIYRTEQNTAKQAVEKFLQGQLLKLEKPTKTKE